MMVLLPPAAAPPMSDELIHEILRRQQSMAERQETMAERQETMAERQETMAERQETMAERQEAMAERQEAMAERQEAMAERQEAFEERMRRSEAWQEAFTEEHRQLVEFLGRKFGVIDARFAAVDARFESLEARVAKNGVSIESLEHRLQIVAEGVRLNGDRIDRLQARSDDRFDHLIELIQAYHHTVITRLDRLEEREGI
jgi:chromosome segregation ATPase